MNSSIASFFGEYFEINPEFIPDQLPVFNSFESDQSSNSHRQFDGYSSVSRSYSYHILNPKVDSVWGGFPDRVFVSGEIFSQSSNQAIFEILNSIPFRTLSVFCGGETFICAGIWKPFRVCGWFFSRSSSRL